MADLFASTHIKDMTMPNRFVRSATWEGLASQEGHASEALTNMMINLVHGRVGLIITGHACVSAEGIAAPGQLGVYSDGHVASLKQMVDAVHDAGGRIALQVSHGGRYALKLPGVVRIGPSTIESKGEVQCREMTDREISMLVTQFADAARRAKTAGFDAIQIHAAHGYLVSQFLSPYFNKRTDAYGGAAVNRARLLLDIVRAIRREVGERFPVLVKLNCQDYLEGGYTVEDMLEVASLLQEASVDAIEMSGGNHVGGIFGEFFPARKGRSKEEGKPYYLAEARLFKDRINIPLMLVGGIRSLQWAEHIASQGYADFVSLCRPLIREPDLIRRWQSGDTRQSSCVSDNGCFKPGLEGKGIYCTVEALERKH